MAGPELEWSLYRQAVGESLSILKLIFTFVRVSLNLAVQVELASTLAVDGEYCAGSGC